MIYFYVKAVHIIFIVTWFAGLFYMPRLFIYATEAQEKTEPEKSILTRQFQMMSKRLWYGITWPSAVLTLIFGTWMGLLYGTLANWLLIKICFVILLYAYHFSLHVLFKQEKNGIFIYSSQQLRIWNEVATIFLIAIVMLAVVKQGVSLVYGLIGLVLLIVLLLSAIKLYKSFRK
jgi:putative membrane protein